jgi:PAS domain S-box-containing protein
MKLRNKMLAIVGLTIVVMMLVAYPLLHLWMTDNYREMEMREMQDEVNHTRNAISFDLASLRSTTVDYAVWNDTFEFVRTGHPGYVESSFADDMFITQRLNLALIADRDDRIVYSRCFDLAEGVDTDIREDIAVELRPGSLLLMQGDDNGTTGFLNLPGGLMMISAYPILKSDRTGPPEGTLIMGRYFDDAELGVIRDIAGIEVSLKPLSAEAVNRTGGDMWITAVGGNNIDGDTLLYDVHGKPAAVLSISLPRPIYQQGQKDILMVTVSVICGIILFSAIIALLLEWSIILPILRVSDSVARIGRDRNQAGRVPVEGHSEIGGLAMAINGTMESLELAGLKLHDSELRFRSLVESLSDVVWETDGGLRYTYVSPRSRKVMGYEPDELLGKTPFDLMPYGERERLTPIVKGLIASDKAPVRIEIGVLRPDGTMTDLEVSLSAITGPAGQVAGFRGIARDIGERRRAEVALRESEERLRLCAATACFGTFDWDIANDRHVWSSETYDIYGVRPATPLTLDTMKGLIYPGDQHDAALAAYLDPAGPGEYTMEYRIIRASDHEVRWAFVRGRVIFAGEGPERKAVRVLGAIQDITERKQAETQMMGSLQEKEVLLKEIHHRVKNNLQIISSLLNLQSEKINSENPARAFQESQDRIRSMALIHEKLYQSRDISRIDFAEYVRSLTSYLARSYVTGRDVTIVVDIEDLSLGIDLAIPCGLIINELVSNALKYAFPDGKTGEVRISLAQCGNEYELTVSDNGAGLPAGLDFRNTSSLGLQLVNTLVHQLEGDIALDTARGTRFSITFAG